MGIRITLSIIAIVFSLSFVCAQTPDGGRVPFVWGNFALEGIVQEDYLKTRAGIRVDTEGEIHFHLKQGFRLAKSSWSQIWLYPFWMNFSPKDIGYNTPITLEVQFIDERWLEASVLIDLYGEFEYMPSLTVSVPIIKANY